VFDSRSKHTFCIIKGRLHCGSAQKEACVCVLDAYVLQYNHLMGIC